MSETLPDVVEDLPPSSRWVFRELRQADSPLTVTQLQRRTGYSPRGIRHATEALLDEKLIDYEFTDDDPRRKEFRARG